MKFRHPPVVQKFSTTNGVAKMNLPVVSPIHVSQRCRHSAFRHHGMGFSQKALGENPGVQTENTALNRRAETGSPGADHQDIVFNGFDFGDVHGAWFQVLKSWMIPIEARRT